MESRRPLKRFIPTPVGNGIEAAESASESAVHPHACGERKRYLNSEGFENGSSPRLWGTAHPLHPVRFPPRFIPTPVGNGFQMKFCVHTPTVHPHACGERACLAAPPSSEDGSSPRLWGTGRLPPLMG